MDQDVAIISVPMLDGRVRASLEKLGLRVARLWELSDADRRQARIIVHVGEMVLGPELLETMPCLRLIAHLSVGYDGVDVPWCRAHGIEVTHSKSLNAEDVADHAIGLLIGAWRNIVLGDRVFREGGWRDDRRLIAPRALRGRKVGIVGLGAIGTAVARRVEAFGMTVAWWGPHAREAPWPMAPSVLALATDSDILVVAARSDASNRGLISREVIEAVGPQGLIVNVARGALIDEDALIEAVRDGRLGRIALDVYAQEPTPIERWLGLPNTVLTPHNGGASLDAGPLMAAQVIENVRRFLADEPLLSPAP